MSPTYTSLEDGQVIKTKEPREDLDALARWKRDDVDPEPELHETVPSGTTPVAGPVNTTPITGGEPPLTSTTAGIADPASAMSPEEAQRRAAAALGDGTQAEPDAGAPTGDVAADTGTNTESGPERPALNGSTEEWTAYAKHPSIALDIAADAGRDAIVAAYIEKNAPAGNAGKEEWAGYAGDHGVTVDEKDGRDKIRAAVIEAGWAKA